MEDKEDKEDKNDNDDKAITLRTRNDHLNYNMNP